MLTAFSSPNPQSPQPRAFFPPGLAVHGSQLGLLYQAKQGEVPLDRPSAVLLRETAPGAPRVLSADPLAGSVLVVGLGRLAARAWWTEGHAGWQVLPLHPVSRRPRGSAWLRRMHV
jgi:hypothetical protein